MDKKTRRFREGQLVRMGGYDTLFVVVGPSSTLANEWQVCKRESGEDGPVMAVAAEQLRLAGAMRFTAGDTVALTRTVKGEAKGYLPGTKGRIVRVTQDGRYEVRLSHMEELVGPTASRTAENVTVPEAMLESAKEYEKSAVFEGDEIVDEVKRITRVLDRGEYLYLSFTLRQHKGVFRLVLVDHPDDWSLTMTQPGDTVRFTVRTPTKFDPREIESFNNLTLGITSDR